MQLLRREVAAEGEAEARVSALSKRAMLPLRRPRVRSAGARLCLARRDLRDAKSQLRVCVALVSFVSVCEGAYGPLDDCRKRVQASSRCHPEGRCERLGLCSCFSKSYSKQVSASQREINSAEGCR